MNKIDEIALRVAVETCNSLYGSMADLSELTAEDKRFYHAFAHALLAELSKDAKPVGHTAMSGHGRVFSSSRTPPPIQPELWKPVFTHPAPANTAEIEQQAKKLRDLVEQEVAEACAKVSESGMFIGDICTAIRSGKWREYL